MEKVYDEKFGTSYRPNCAEEWLELLCDIAVDYDGCNTVESLKKLVDELKGYAHKARMCLHEGKLFGNRKLTQFKRIKNMSVEEMAEMLFEEMENTFSYCDYCEHYKYHAPHCSAPDTKQGCINAIKKYLESEVQGE